MDKAPSPCTGVCRLDSEGTFCLGCKRSLDEIADWAMLTETEKSAVLKALAAC